MLTIHSIDTDKRNARVRARSILGPIKNALLAGVIIQPGLLFLDIVIRMGALDERGSLNSSAPEDMTISQFDF